MLKGIRTLLTGALLGEILDKPVTPATTPPSGPVPPGYFIPASAAQLLDMPVRKKCLQQLWENTSLPADLFSDFYRQPLDQLTALMQVLPAGPEGEYAREGGMADVTLQTVTYAVRLARGYMLPPGAAPEEQAAQGVMWNTVVFCAALWHYLPLFTRIEGELLSGRPWIPGLTVPGEPYRFRFRTHPPAPALITAQNAMTATRLLPAAVIAWLSTLPAAAESLMLTAARQPGALPVLEEIVREAVRLARGEALLTLSTPASVVAPATAVTAPPATPPVTAAPSPVAAESATTATLALQSDLPPADDALVAKAPPAGADILPAEKPPATDVLLGSALDTPVNDRPLAEMVLVPETVVETEADMKALLALMNVSLSPPAERVAHEEAPAAEEAAPVPPVPEAAPVPSQHTSPVTEVRQAPAEESNVPVPAPAAPVVSFSPHESEGPSSASHPPVADLPAESPSGEAFWQWLSAGLLSGEIPVNTPGARAHLVAGFIFITVPGIFYSYLKQSGLESDQREFVQENFERLDRHRRVKGKRFYFAHLYDSPPCTGPFKRTKGYLIKASLLYRGKRMPEDSPVLQIP